MFEHTHIHARTHMKHTHTLCLYISLTHTHTHRHTILHTLQFANLQCFAVVQSVKVFPEGFFFLLCRFTFGLLFQLGMFYAND